MSLFSCQSDGNIFCPRQVCPSSSPAADHSLACAALLQPGGGFGRGEVIPRQALPPLPATSSHLEGNQGCLRKPPSFANHHCHHNSISTGLPPPSLGSLASGHPALRLRQSIPGAHQTLLSPDKKQIEMWQKKCARCAQPTRSLLSTLSSTHWTSTTLRSKSFLSSEARCLWVGGWFLFQMFWSKTFQWCLFQILKIFDQKHFSKDITTSSSVPFVRLAVPSHTLTC